MNQQKFGCKTVCCCLVAKLCPALQQLHGLQPTRLLCQWDFLGKNIRVGCHFLLQRDLFNPGIKSASSTLPGGFLTTELPGEPVRLYNWLQNKAGYSQVPRAELQMMFSETPKFRSVVSGDHNRFYRRDGIVLELLLLQFEFINYFNEIISAHYLRIKQFCKAFYNQCLLFSLFLSFPHPGDNNFNLFSRIICYLSLHS